MFSGFTDATADEGRARQGLELLVQCGTGAASVLSAPYSSSEVGQHRGGWIREERDDRRGHRLWDEAVGNWSGGVGH